MECKLCGENKASFMVWDLDEPTCICSDCDRSYAYVKKHDTKNKYAGYYSPKIVFTQKANI